MLSFIVGAVVVATSTDSASHPDSPENYDSTQSCSCLAVIAKSFSRLTRAFQFEIAFVGLGITVTLITSSLTPTLNHYLK